MFSHLVQSLDQGLKSLEVAISSSCAAAVDNLAAFYFRNVLQARTRQLVACLPACSRCHSKASAVSKYQQSSQATLHVWLPLTAQVTPDSPVVPGARELEAHVRLGSNPFPGLLR
jgi:hypothetical protein